MAVELLFGDCMEYMRTLPDKAFDLAIVDPPYGIGVDGNSASTGSHGGRKAHTKKQWDSTRPDAEYFAELFRVSENQIIWGANYFAEYLPPSMGWVFWDKGQRINNSDGELAYTSFNRALRVIEINRVALLIEGTIHPTQKPIKLYKWLLHNYAKQGQRILDTHLGSGSIAIACHDMGFDLTGIELDPDYYNAAKRRVEQHQSQLAMC